MEAAKVSRFKTVLTLSLTVMIFALVFLIVMTSSEVTRIVAQGIKLCGTTLIPALFPILVISGFLTRIGAPQMLSRRLGGVMKGLFGVSGVSASAIITGLICGFPSGASALLLNGKPICSKDEGSRALFLSATASPAFVISGVGIGMLGSAALGVSIFIIHILSVILTGILLNKIFGCKAAADYSTEAVSPRLSLSSVAEAIRAAADAMISVCGAVIFFSVISGCFYSICEIPDTLRCLLSSFFELASGTRMISEAMPHDVAFVMIAAAVSWSGVSVHSQIILVTKGLFTTGEYFIGKAVSTLISVILAIIYIKYFCY